MENLAETGSYLYLFFVWDQIDTTAMYLDNSTYWSWNSWVNSPVHTHCLGKNEQVNKMLYKTWCRGVCSIVWSWWRSRMCKIYSTLPAVPVESCRVQLQQRWDLTSNANKSMSNLFHNWTSKTSSNMRLCMCLREKSAPHSKGICPSLWQEITFEKQLD